MVDTNKEARDAACREALLLLAEEQAAFEAWRDSLETVPTIKALRTKAEDIRQAEFEKVRVSPCSRKYDTLFYAASESCCVHLTNSALLNKMNHSF